MAVSLFATCLIATSAVAQKSSPALIDVHAHLSPGPGLTFDQAAKEAIRAMDRFGVARAIIMSPPRPRDFSGNFDYPDFQNALKPHADRLVFAAGGGSLNLILHGNADPASVSETVRRQFAKVARRAVDAGAVGFGEMGSLHISLASKHGYSYVPADHPLLRLLADIAAERGVPLDLHMDAVTRHMKTPASLAKFPNNPGTFPATLDALERLLLHNPKAKIVWGHAGADHLGDFTPDAVGQLLDKHPGLIVSLKVAGPKAPLKNKLLAGRKLNPAWRAVLTRHADRFVIGTDNFYAGPKIAVGAPPKEFSRTNVPKLQATQLFLSLLPANVARKIGSENAIRLYKLATLPAAPAIASPPPAPSRAAPKKTGLCRDGNMEHCKIACQKGVKKACAKLKRGG
jgi:predicted TIM-barrel fold metal-dependent hydrolase